MSDEVILFELTTPAGVEQVSVRTNIEKAVEKAGAVAAKAVEKMKATIVGISVHAIDVTKKLQEQDIAPNELEVSFGLTVDIEGNVWVTKVGAGASVNITLKWNNLDQ